jgi:polygalacturonase
VEVNGELRRALFLFADPPETNIPKQDDPQVRWFAGGQIHDAGEIHLKDGQTIYLAPGAVVRGVIRADGANGAKVLGRGVLDATTRTNKLQMVSFTRCTNLVMNGPIVLGSYGWTLVPKLCQEVTFRNVKVAGWRDNDDGLDIVSSRRITVDHCFFRTKDDCISVKAFQDSLAYTDIRTSSKAQGAESESVGNRSGQADVAGVLVTNSVFWNAEWGNALEIGYELRTASVRDLVFQNCDIIREEKGAALSIHNGDIAVVENARFEDVRLEDLTGKFVDLQVGLSIYSEDCPQEYSRRNPKRKPTGDGPWLKLTGEDLNAHAKYRGGIRNIHFKNIQITGPQMPPSLICGYGPNHMVQDISFENVTCNGKPVLDAKQAGLTMDNAENVRFR